MPDSGGIKVMQFTAGPLEAASHSDNLDVELMKIDFLY